MKTVDRVIWGILCKPRTNQGKWWLSIRVEDHLFNARVDALSQCNEWNIMDGGYIYKPIALRLVGAWEE